MTLRQFPVNLLVLSMLVLTGCNATEHDWKRAKEVNTTSSYADFLNKHPKGAHTEEAIENLDWNKALSASDPQAFFDYFRAHPDSSRVSVRRVRLASHQELSLIPTGPPSINNPLDGMEMSAKLVVTLDGAEAPFMTTEKACTLGILECKPGSDIYTKPPSLALVVTERVSGAILAVDFSGGSNQEP